MGTLSYVGAIEAIDMPEVFTHAEAMARGVSDRVLYGWRDSGSIEQLARGIYTQPDLIADPDLIEIAVRAPDATLCLATALARHQLIDDIPPSINAAIPRGQRAPRTAAPAFWHRFDATTFDIGRSRMTVHGELSIGIYDPARSIVDAFRLRHLYGEDMAITATRRWLGRHGNHPVELLDVAHHFPAAEASLRQVLMVLQ